MGRPETDVARKMAMSTAWERFAPRQDHHEDALSVKEAELSVKRRIGVSEHNILVVQSNLAKHVYRARTA